MHIARSADIALRVLMYTAVHPGRHIIDELATVLGVSRNHLAKVVQRLQQLGMIDTTRGRGGGVTLAVDADRITAGQVVRAFDGVAEVVDCDETAMPCPLNQSCRLRSALRRAQEAFLGTLDEVPLADLVTDPTRPVLLNLSATVHN